MAQQVELIGVRLVPELPAYWGRHCNALRPAGQSKRANGARGGIGVSGGCSIGFGNIGKSKKSNLLDGGLAEACPTVKALNVKQKRRKIECFFMFADYRL